jgi:hypothetical protein
MDGPNGRDSRQEGSRLMHDTQKAFSESGSSPPLKAKVIKVQITPGSTIATGEAVDAVGRAILFAGDWRPMLAIAEALEAGEPIEVYLEDWQIIAWRRP